MTKIIRIAALACIAPTLAFADTGSAAYIPHPDWILFALAMILAAWWSAQAFDRPPIALADTPTYPKYMTRPNLYNFGEALFVALSLTIYALMIHYHTDLPELIKAIKPDWYEPLRSVIEQKDPSYLIIIVMVSSLLSLSYSNRKRLEFLFDVSRYHPFLGFYSSPYQ
jgi:hypothetical protein